MGKEILRYCPRICGVDMTAEYHCGNCPHAPAKEINKRYDKFDTYKYFCKLKNMWIFGTAFNTIEIVGCLSHPSAQAALRAEGAKEALLSKENITVSTVYGYEAGLEDGAMQERERVLNERIRDIELIISLCRSLRHQFPSDISLEMTQEQHERELKNLESLRQSQSTGGGE